MDILHLLLDLKGHLVSKEVTPILIINYFHHFNHSHFHPLDLIHILLLYLNLLVIC